MKILYNSILIAFCALTFGLVDVTVRYSDGTSFEWRGWVSRIMDWWED